jgi:hypothetical protein
MIRFGTWKDAERVFVRALALVIALAILGTVLFALIALYVEWPDQTGFGCFLFTLSAGARAAWRSFRARHWMPYDPAVEYPPGTEPRPTGWGVSRARVRFQNRRGIAEDERVSAR